MKLIAKAFLAALSSNPLTRKLLRRASLRGLIPLRLWWWMPVDGPFRVEVGRGATFLYRGRPGDRLGQSLHWTGLSYYEPETFHVFIELARTARVFLDIGASVGLYSLVASAVNPRLRSYAFEPLPNSYQRLVDHIELNKLQERCTAINVAVSDREGRAEFFVADAPYTDCSSLAYLQSPGGRPGSTVEVRCATATDAVPSDQLIDLVKIDVEGAEALVLAGLLPILLRSRPALIVEFWPNSCQAGTELLRRLGYTFFHLTDQGPIRVDVVAPSTVRNVYLNYLCLPPT